MSPQISPIFLFSPFTHSATLTFTNQCNATFLQLKNFYLQKKIVNSIRQHCMQIIQNPVSMCLAVYKQSLILNTRVDKAYFVISVTYSFWHLFVYFFSNPGAFTFIFFSSMRCSSNLWQKNWEVFVFRMWLVLERNLRKDRVTEYN